MGVVEELDYRVGSQILLQRAINRVAGTWPMPCLMAPVLPRLDAFVSRASRGRASLTRAGGQEPLWVTVRGSRSGRPRRVPLLAFPIGDDLAVIASNFGRPELPDWAADLRAHPEVDLTLGERSTPAVAREATDDEAEDVWRTATGILPTYAGYRKRVTTRPIPVFIFEPGIGPDAA